MFLGNNLLEYKTLPKSLKRVNIVVLKSFKISLNIFQISLKYDYNKAYNFLRMSLFYTVSAVPHRLMGGGSLLAADSRGRRLVGGGEQPQRVVLRARPVPQPHRHLHAVARALLPPPLLRLSQPLATFL
jgi:hypothetical protein